MAVSAAGAATEQMCLPESCTLLSTSTSVCKGQGFANAGFATQGLEKTIPDTPKGQTPIHLRDKQVFADYPTVVMPWEKDVGIKKKDASQPQ